MTPTWRFRRMAPGELNIDPFEGEFFTTEALGSVTDALVREAIQNSLDAARSRGIVRVRFAMGGAAPSPAPESAAPYLSDLWPHLGARKSGVRARVRESDPLTFVAVEDFGTRGLEGDPEQFRDADEGTRTTRNDFYWFWRNIGRSLKSTGERGRWGLGKTVFQAASRINAFFGLTVRRSDEQSLLMGQAVLKIHTVDGKQFAPYGYFGRHRGARALPVADRREVREFAETFSLERGSEAGLSIVIPFPHPEITAPAVVDSVIRHYFYPLIAGGLEVRIDSLDSGDSVHLDAESVDAFLRSSRIDRREEHMRLFGLARWGMEPPPESQAALASPSPGRAPRYGDGLFETQDLERLRRRFEEGARIALEGAVPVQPSGRGRVREGRFLLLLERDDHLTRGQGYFVRQGITIENERAPRPRGVRWILVVTDDSLSALLGDAENPAHTEWQRNSPSLKARYTRGPSTLDFVRALPRNVVSTLSRPVKGRDPDLLRRIFSLPRDAALKIPRSGEPAADEASVEGGTRNEPAPDVTPRPSPIQLSPVQGGFRVTGAALNGALPERLVIEVAYEVRRGNPFRRYVPLDFAFDRRPVAVRAKGAEVIAAERNRMTVVPRKSEFELLATGFDPHRDLRIKIVPQGDGG